MITPGVASLTYLLQTLLPEPHAGLLAGLLFGVKSSIPPSLYDALVTTGTLHIIALSGMNISILSGMIQRSFTPLFGKKAASVGTLFLVAGFVWFVGPSPSIVRAAIMGGLSLTAYITGRQYWPIYAWGLAVVSMLFLHPGWIGDISFQLSAGATFGIILFGRQMEPPRPSPSKWWETARELIRDDLHLTLSAQVCTVPLIFWYFHRISLIAPIANVLIGWVIAPLTGLGWIAVFGGMLWHPFGQTVSWICWIFLEYIVRTVYFVSRMPGASISL